MSKKANGVYYTPRPVVDYIVRNTLEPLLANKSPMQIAGCNDDWKPDQRGSPLTLLDPACGVGDFLLGAYDFLLDWCLRWYQSHDKERWLCGPKATICQVEQQVQLSLAERKRILRDHIFGVDIDGQAVAKASRSLLAKSHAEATISNEQLSNLQVGNSLIGTDFQHDLAIEVRSDVRPFDWDVEFSSVAESGGFDVIVGNPPYVNARLIKQEQGEAVKRYYREKYRCATRAFDLYVLFIEQTHKLLRDGGRAGLIVPNKIASLDYAESCRKLLLEESTIESITDISDLNLFQGARVYPYIITWTKKRAAPTHAVQVVSAGKSNDLSVAECSHHIQQSNWSADTGITLFDRLDVESRVPTRPLEQCGSIQTGTTGFDAEQVAAALKECSGRDSTGSFNFIVSGNIDRYRISLGKVRFMKRSFNRPVLEIDTDAISAGKRRLFAAPKIVIAGMGRRLEAAFDPGGLALGVQVYAISDLNEGARYLLGLLNSKLMSYLLRTRYQAKRLYGDYLAINKGQLAMLPIRLIADDDEESNLIRTRIVDHVQRLSENDVHADHEIDQLVYRLYRLMPNEIEAIEYSTIEPSA